MRTLLLLLALGLTSFTGCTATTKNVGHGGLAASRFALTGISFSTTTPHSGQDVTATINFSGVSGPFVFAITFSDGVTPAVHTVTAPSGATSASLTFTLDSFLLADDPDGKEITVTVTCVDGNGSTGGPVTGTLHINGIPNQLPGGWDDSSGSGAGHVPEPEPDPEPHIETEAERLARIEATLSPHNLSALNAADLIWYDRYWQTHTPEHNPPSTFPVAGVSLIDAVEFAAPNRLKVSLNPVLVGDYHYLSLSAPGDQVRGWEWDHYRYLHEVEIELHFSLVGPQRASIPLTVHVENTFGHSEELLVYIPLPELAVEATASGKSLHVGVTGDDLTDHGYHPQLGSTHLGMHGAYVLAGNYWGNGAEQPGGVDLPLRFAPRGPEPPAVLVVGHSAFWRYRSKLVEFTDLPVKGWNYDYATSVLHVDARDSAVQISLTLPDGLRIDAPAGGSADLAVPRTEASYRATLHALAGGEEETYDVRLGNAAASLPMNTLRAWPLQSSVGVGEPVRILVASGLTAQPFQYMTGCRVTATAGSGMRFVRRSFNAGAPGGKAGFPDGGWDAMDFEDYLLAPDGFIANHPADMIDFNVTPLNAQDVYFEGELFNFEATFDTPGQVMLGFEAINTVSRTYYQDGNQAPDYFWTDISNAEVDGLPSPCIDVN